MLFAPSGSTRRSRRHLIALTGVAIAAATVLAGCTSDGGSGGSGAGGSSSARAQTLIIAENEVPASFDPAQADNSTVDEVVLPAYDTLVSYDGNKLGGDLATSWKVSADGLSIDVVLHDGVTFHDGTTLTADDVAYTLDRLHTVNIGAASFLTAYKATTVTDPTHLTITLSTPDATFVPALSRVYVVEKALVEKNLGSDNGQAWLATHDAGSGPYVLQKYVSNQSATYAQYAKYWKGFTGQAKKLEFHYFSSAAEESQALKAGDVDIAMDIAPSEWAAYKKDSGFTVDQATTNVGLYAFFNMAGTSTKDKALRQAISMAYDYKSHVSSILKGAGTEMDGVLPTGFGIPTDGVTQPSYDLKAAKQLVDSNGLSGTTVTMTYFKATTEMEQAATLLQSALDQIGLKLKVQAVTYPAYVTMASKASTRPDIAEVYAFPAFPDPSAIMYQNFDSKFIGSGQNWGAYSNPEVDKLVEAAQSSTDESARKADYLKAEQIVTGDYVTINMANSKYVTVFDKRVQGYTYQPSHHQTVDVYAITLSGK